MTFSRIALCFIYFGLILSFSLDITTLEEIKWFTIKSYESCKEDPVYVECIRSRECGYLSNMEFVDTSEIYFQIMWNEALEIHEILFFNNSECTTKSKMKAYEVDYSGCSEIELYNPNNEYFTVESDIQKIRLYIHCANHWSFQIYGVFSLWSPFFWCALSLVLFVVIEFHICCVFSTTCSCTVCCRKIILSVTTKRLNNLKKNQSWIQDDISGEEEEEFFEHDSIDSATYNTSNDDDDDETLTSDYTSSSSFTTIETLTCSSISSITNEEDDELGSTSKLEEGGEEEDEQHEDWRNVNTETVDLGKRRSNSTIRARSKSMMTEDEKPILNKMNVVGKYVTEGGGASEVDFFDILRSLPRIRKKKKKKSGRVSKCLRSKCCPLFCCFCCCCCLRKYFARILKSVLIVFIVEFKQSLGLLFSLIMVTSVELSEENVWYISDTSIDNVFKLFFLTFMVVYLLVDYFLCFFWVRHYVISPWCTLLIISGLKEWIYYRILMSSILIYGFFFGCSVLFFNLLYGNITIDLTIALDNVEGYFNIFLLLIPLLLLLNEVKSILGHDGVGSITTVKKIHALPFCDLLLIPRIPIPVFEAINSYEGLISDILFSISHVGSTGKFDFESNQMKHLPIEDLEKALTMEEIMFYYAFFFLVDKNEDRYSSWRDSILHETPCECGWWKLICFGACCEVCEFGKEKKRIKKEAIGVEVELAEGP